MKYFLLLFVTIGVVPLVVAQPPNWGVKMGAGVHTGFSGGYGTVAVERCFEKSLSVQAEAALGWPVIGRSSLGKVRSSVSSLALEGRLYASLRRHPAMTGLYFGPMVMLAHSGYGFPWGEGLRYRYHYLISGVSMGIQPPIAKRLRLDLGMMLGTLHAFRARQVQNGAEVDNSGWQFRHPPGNGMLGLRAGLSYTFGGL